VNILDSLNAQVVHVEVISLKDETYFGNIVISINGTLHNIDSRPSDAMNLAVRLQVPIFVAEGVLDEAGLIPEEDLGETGLDEEVDSERLSIFENYLDQIAPDESEIPPDEDDTGEEDPK
jgi:bifunctional DNase/RNase